jgi:hypothetical protein
MLRRRALLAGLAAATLSCRRDPSERTQPSTSAAPDPSSPPSRGPTGAAPASARPPEAAASSAASEPRGPAEVTTRTLDFSADEGGPQQAVVMTPAWGAAGERFPLLVALGGLGETRKGIAVGASAWVKEYWLDRAMRRLREPPLRSADFQELVTPARLAALNASLAARPFRGLVVACPFTPDLWTHPSLDSAGPFARFVVAQLLPRVRAEAPALEARAATGIDGVSLGGRVALLSALDQPESFAAVGAMQGAFVPEEIAELSRRTAEGVQRRGLQLRLITSAHDVYRPVILDLHRALVALGAAHEQLDLPGPHALRWNRGPGALEMLLWHDRALRGEAPLR